MRAVFNREMKSYFNSMLAYVYLTISMVLCGVMFFLMCIMTQTSQMTGYFSNVISWSIFLLPLLTMRMYSEDKKQRTDVLLLTSPISIWEMVIGKFLSAYAVFLIGTAITLIFPIILNFFGTVPVPEVISCYVGYVLFCGVIIAIGSFMSAVTESQIVAAISTFGIVLLTILLGNFANVITWEAATSAIMWISPMDRFSQFSGGILSIEDIIYYLSFIALFLFLTGQVFERRRFK